MSTRQIDRRAMMRGTASALPALAVLPTAGSAAALMTGSDPVYAAIEAHRAAWDYCESNPSARKVEQTPEDDAEIDRRSNLLDGHRADDDHRRGGAPTLPR